MLGLFLRSELTYDQHHENHERIYRIAVNEFGDGRSSDIAVTSGVLGPMLVEEYPEFKSYVRFRDCTGTTRCCSVTKTRRLLGRQSTSPTTTSSTCSRTRSSTAIRRRR